MADGRRDSECSEGLLPPGSVSLAQGSPHHSPDKNCLDASFEEDDLAAANANIPGLDVQAGASASPLRGPQPTSSGPRQLFEEDSEDSPNGTPTSGGGNRPEKVTVAVCAMQAKTDGKPFQQILSRLLNFMNTGAGGSICQHGLCFQRRVLQVLSRRLPGVRDHRHEGRDDPSRAGSDRAARCAAIVLGSPSSPSNGRFLSNRRGCQQIGVNMTPSPPFG